MDCLASLILDLDALPCNRNCSMRDFDVVQPAAEEISQAYCLESVTRSSPFPLSEQLAWAKRCSSELKASKVYKHNSLKCQKKKQMFSMRSNTYFSCRVMETTFPDTNGGLK
jgi:hypothetical protein